VGYVEDGQVPTAYCAVISLSHLFKNHHPTRPYLEVVGITTIHPSENAFYILAEARFFIISMLPLPPRIILSSGQPHSVQIINISCTGALISSDNFFLLVWRVSIVYSKLAQPGPAAS
jgi:hypothetical protein